MYLTETDNIKARVDQARSGFQKAVTPRNQAGDIEGTQALAKEYIVIWSGFKKELKEVSCPEKAEEYHKILGLVIDLQLESCISVREFSTSILEGKAGLAKLREEDATEEAIQAYLDEQSSKNEKIVDQLSSFKELIPQMDRALKIQRRDLLNEP